MIEPIRTDLRKSLVQGLIDTSEDAPEQRKFRMWRAMSHLSEAEAVEFYARLEKLVDEFNAFKTGDASAENQHYGLLIGIYPALSPRKSPKA